MLQSSECVLSALKRIKLDPCALLPSSVPAWRFPFRFLIIGHDYFCPNISFSTNYIMLLR